MKECIRACILIKHWSYHITIYNSLEKRNFFLLWCFLFIMDIEEEKQLIEEIIKNRRLPYSIEILNVEGNKITVRNNFGSTMVYFKEGENYILGKKLD